MWGFCHNVRMVGNDEKDTQRPMRVARHIRQLAGESAVYGLSGVLGRLVAFFLIPVYTRVFTPADLGTVAMIDAAAALLAMFSVLGLDSATARWFYDSPEDDARRSVVASSFYCQLAVASAVAGVLIVLARPVARLLCGTEYYAGLVRLAACSLPPLAVVRVFGGWLRYRRRVTSAAAYIAFRSLASVGLIILLVAVWHLGLTGLYAARLWVAGIAAVIGLVLLGRWLNPARVSLSRLGEMLAFGLPMVPAAVGVWVMASADRFVLRIFWPQESVGLYDLAAKVASGVALAIVAFQQAWGPFAYSILDRDDAQRVYARVWDVYAFFGSWLAAAVGLFAPLLLRIMATERFYPAASCVAILAFVHLFTGARYIAGLGSGIAKRSMPVAMAVGIGAGVNLLLNFLLVPHWGREGAALGTVAAAGVSVVYLFIASQKNHAIDYRLKIAAWSLAVSASMVAAAWLYVPQATPVGLAIRALMLSAFVPLGVFLGILKRNYLRDFFVYFM